MFTTRPIFSVGPGVLSKHLVAAKFVVMILTGTVVGYALAIDLAEDVKRGEMLTMEEYVAAFDDYKADLRASGMSTAEAVAAGLIMMVGALSIYEALSVTLAWGIAVLGRGVERTADQTTEGGRSALRDLAV